MTLKQIGIKRVAKINLSLVERLYPLLVSLFVVSGLIIVRGYAFPTDNHTVEIPPILSMLDSGLYSKDFFVQEMLQFTPRTYYNYLVYLLAQTGLGVPLSLFIYHVAAVASFVFGLRAIAKIYCKSSLSGIVLCFWVLTATVGTLGGNELFRAGPYPPGSYPSIYALGIAIWGLYFSLRRRWRCAYGFFGAACLLQFLVGALPAVLISPLLLFDTWKTRRWLWGSSALLLFAVGVGLVYIPMVLQGATSTGVLSDREFVELYGYIRHPHHIVPSTWSRQDWLQFLLFYLGGGICLSKTRSLNPRYRLGLIVVVGMMFLGLLVNFVFVEIYPLAVVAKLQLARMTPYSKLAILIGLTALFDEHLRKHNWTVCLFLVPIPISHHPGLLLVVFALGLKALTRVTFASKIQWSGLAIAIIGYQFLSRTRLLTTVRGIIAGSALIAVLLIPYLLKELLPKQTPRTAVAGTLAVISTSTLVLGITNLLPRPLNQLFNRQVAINQPATRKQGDKELPPEIIQLAFKFNALSTKDALVIVPPSVHKFGLLSERSILVNFKRFPYTDRGIVEWQNRMEAILGVPLKNISGFASRFDELYSSRRSQDLVQVARQYKAGYILSRQDWHSDLPGKVIAQEGAWRIWQISLSNSSKSF